MIRFALTPVLAKFKLAVDDCAAQGKAAVNRKAAAKILDRSMLKRFLLNEKN